MKRAESDAAWIARAWDKWLCAQFAAGRTNSEIVTSEEFRSYKSAWLAQPEGERAPIAREHPSGNPHPDWLDQHA